MHGKYNSRLYFHDNIIVGDAEASCDNGSFDPHTEERISPEDEVEAVVMKFIRHSCCQHMHVDFEYIYQALFCLSFIKLVPILNFFPESPVSCQLRRDEAELSSHQTISSISCFLP